MSEENDAEKTEEPTQRRLEDAIKRGQVIFSREVMHFVMLLVGAFLVGSILPVMMRGTLKRFEMFIAAPDTYTISAASLLSIFHYCLLGMGVALVLPAAFTLVAAILGSIVQHGIIISGHSLIPNLSRISPLAGFKRIFSFRSIMEFIKGCIKIVVVGMIAFMAIYPELSNLDDLQTYSILDMMRYMGKLSVDVMIGACIMMFFVAILDYLYQRHEYMKQLRMSRQDIKDEFKYTEGNPEVRAKLKEIRRERAKRRMMSAVPEADVVVTNPTHFSVALRYQPELRDAPVIVAKGQDHIALKIREIAREHNVPIVENPPLARALFDTADIDEEVPLEHYQAVAEVIRYVYELKGKLPKEAA